MRISDWISVVCSSVRDVMPTLVELAGATSPKSYNGHAILPMEGRSMAPAFRGEALTRGKPIFWEHEGNRAVRDGKWKLVAGFQKPWQLFDMTADRTEMHDLAATEPGRVPHKIGRAACGERGGQNGKNP